MNLRLKVLLFLILGYTIACSNQQSSISSKATPLPECPDSPNCELRSYEFEQEKSKLVSAFSNVLNKMNVHEMSQNERNDSIQIDAIFKIPVFGWLDDVTILITSSEVDSTTNFAHLRSASREGYFDLGVNKRRLNKIYKNVQKELNSK